MDDGDNELDLLLHSFGKFLHLPVPPAHDLEFLKPVFQPFLCFMTCSSPFNRARYKRLFADIHFFIKSAFFRQVSDHGDVGRSKAFALEKISPSSGAMIWLMIRIKVVLPAPLGPSSPKMLFFGNVISLPCRALCGCILL